MSPSIVDDIRAIRDKWHTKRHPFFLAFGEGKLPLRAMGVYKAMHGRFVQHALASFGIVYARTIPYDDVRKAVAENIAEEEGFKAIPGDGSRGGGCMAPPLHEGRTERHHEGGEPQADPAPQCQQRQ